MKLEFTTPERRKWTAGGVPFEIFIHQESFSFRFFVGKILCELSTRFFFFLIKGESVKVKIILFEEKFRDSSFFFFFLL